MMLLHASSSPALLASRQRRCPLPHRPMLAIRAQNSNNRSNASSPAVVESISPSLLLQGAALLTPFMLPVGSALAAAETVAAAAAAPEHDIIKGSTAALLHPALMLFLLGATGYAGYLGWQWRRTRTMPEEIKALKAQLPPAPAEGDRPASPLDAQIKALEQERKTLVQGNFRDKHWQWSSLLLAMGTGIAIEGAANTFIRTGKLFPGPHLYFGVTIVFLWAMAAALVPAMQKGNDTARTAHISLNALNVFLFLSQVPTGLEIVEKVFQFTTFP